MLQLCFTSPLSVDGSMVVGSETRETATALSDSGNVCFEDTEYGLSVVLRTLSVRYFITML